MQSKQKICINTDNQWSKKCSCFCANELCLSMRCLEICENNSDSSLESLIVLRVESFGKKRDSRRVTSISQSHLNQLTKSLTQVESSHWLESRYHLHNVRTHILYHRLCNIWQIPFRRVARNFDSSGQTTSTSHHWNIWCPLFLQALSIKRFSGAFFSE